MNLNSELFLNRNYIIKKKHKIQLDYLKPFQQLSSPNTNPLRNKYTKKTKEFFFDKFNRIDKNNEGIINNIITPTEKSYYTEANQSQVNRDIYGYNNYIINKNSFNTINFTSKKAANPKASNISNFNYADTPSYLTAYESASNFNTINKNNKQHLQTDSNDINNNYNNNDIQFMNMKLNFKILQQKLSHLKDIANSNNKDSFKTPYKLTNFTNNISGYNNEYIEKKYPIKVYRSEGVNNFNKFKKILKAAKVKDYTNKKLIEKKGIIRNLKIKNNNILKNNNNNFPSNINNENDLIKIKIKNQREKNYLRERYYTNDNSFKKHKKKEESELSQLADTILALNESVQNFENNYNIKDKSFEIPKDESNKKNIIIKNKNKKNNYKFISNELEEISINKEYNQTQNNNDQNIKLIVEHIFSYNSTENKKNGIEDNPNENKSIIKNKNERNINIVQTNNFILNNLTEVKKNKNEEKEIQKNNNTDIKLKNETKNNKNTEKDFEDDNENNEDDDGDNKIINSLIATASHNFKNEKECENNGNNNSITDFNKHLEKETQKNITFDNNLIYINYYQDFKVTNLHITDSDDKTINYKPKNISKYLKKLTTNAYKVKPIIINSNKLNYNNIINKIQIHNTNIKMNKIKAKQTIKKNIDFIKEVQKKNQSKDRTQSKDKNKKKNNLKHNNSFNIKVNKSNIKPNNNDILTNKK